MRTAAACLIFALTALSAFSGQANQAKKDLDAMQGTWTVELLEYNGKDFKEKFKFSFVIKGDIMSVDGDPAVIKEYPKMKFKLDPATTPRCIDLKVTGGVQLDAAMEGVYEVKGDNMKLCIKVFGQDRPNEFKSPDGSSVALMHLKRQK